MGIPLGDEAYTPTSLERMHEQIEGALRNQSHVFSIVALDSEQTIGRCMLTNLDAINRSAMLGIMIGPEFQNQGYGQEAIRLLLDYAFNLLNLNSVMLGTFSFNARAIAAYKKVGFKEIGRQRSAHHRRKSVRRRADGHSGRGVHGQRDHALGSAELKCGQNLDIFAIYDIIVVRL